MKAHLLVIEDDPSLLDMLDQILSLEGYQVTAVAEVADICNLLEDCRPDLMITDHRLPGKSGSELCRQVKQAGCYQQLPIIMLSAWPQASQSFNQGNYNVFIPKPFDVWAFLSCIEELLQYRAVVAH